MIISTGNITSTRDLRAGQVFKTNEGGTFKIVKVLAGKLVRIKHNDRHGHEMEVYNRCVLKGSISNPYSRNLQGVGFLGVGKHIAHTDKKTTEVYEKWQSIIQRCYNPYKLDKHRKFMNHTVCDTWHSFQDFAEWYTQLEYTDCNYQLVKNLIDLENTVYDATHCFLIPKSISMSLALAKHGKYPYGIKFNKAKGKYQVVLHKKSTGGALTSYDTLKQAIAGYVDHKEQHVKELANEWRNVISNRTYIALMSWKI